MAQTKIKAGLFEGIVGNGTDGYFLMSNGDGTMTWSSTILNPTITSIAYPGSATAADPAGGETITVTGTVFKTGATVTIGGTAAPAVSYVSATEITFTTPAKAAGDYDIVITNTDTGSATYINGISYNGIPSWTTPTGSLGTFASGETISTITLQAAEPDAGTITFNITSGALPTGLSLTGADIDGTTSLETADTLYTFTVTATDDESQATPRTFTITVEKQFISTDNFGIVTYTGSNRSNSRSISELSFSPDLVMHKSRNDGWSWQVLDTVRGAGPEKELQFNSTAPEGGHNAQAYGYMSSFDSNGFTSSPGTSFPNYNEYWNKSGINFVTYCFKGGGSAVSNTDGSITSQVSANQAAGFSIVSYTGTAANATVGHGLSSAPEFWIVKNRDIDYLWCAGVASLGGQGYFDFNTSGQASTSGTPWNSTLPTSSVVHLGTYTGTNGSNNMIMYCFHSVDGYQKVGSYTGTNAPNNVVTTGFRPRWIMIKSTGATNGDWNIFDTVRENEPLGDALKANTSSIEGTEAAFVVDITDTGFELDGASSAGGTGQINSSGITYIYLAIA